LLPQRRPRRRTVGITPAELKDTIDSVLAWREIPPELLEPL
jgi:hypothetical protein